MDTIHPITSPKRFDVVEFSKLYFANLEKKGHLQTEVSKFRLTSDRNVSNIDLDKEVIASLSFFLLKNWSVIIMKNLNYERDNHFILHQPFFQDGVLNYAERMYTKPYQALFYEFQTTAGSSENQNVTYIPNGCMDILFIQNRHGNFMEILGPGTKARPIQLLSAAAYFGIRLKPGLFISYQNLNLKNITNQEIFLEQIEDDLSVFFRELRELHTLSLKAELFHAYFDPCINIAGVNDLTGYILCEINSLQGNIRIHALADDLHYSERHMSRIFQDSMGITPKTFARIVRFQNVIDSILHQPMLSLYDYLAELGYSDQSHFQREFKEYTGITPRRFLSYAQKNEYTFSDSVHTAARQKAS